MLTAVEIAACRSSLRLSDEAIEWITNFHGSQDKGRAPAVLLGESPSPGSNPMLPLWPGPRGTTGARFRELVGLGPDTFLAWIERRNLIDKTVDHWPAQDAITAAWAAIEAAGPRPLIMLGARVTRAVAQAVGRDDTPEPFQWFEAAGTAAIRIPHPSGLCRSYASSDTRRRAALAIKQAWERSLKLVRLRDHDGKATPLAPADRSAPVDAS